MTWLKVKKSPAPKHRCWATRSKEVARDMNLVGEGSQWQCDVCGLVWTKSFPGNGWDCELQGTAPPDSIPRPSGHSEAGGGWCECGRRAATCWGNA